VNVRIPIRDKLLIQAAKVFAPPAPIQQPSRWWDWSARKSSYTEVVTSSTAGLLLSPHSSEERFAAALEVAQALLDDILTRGIELLGEPDQRQRIATQLLDIMEHIGNNLASIRGNILAEVYLLNLNQKEDGSTDILVRREY
jgi:hypothetical protein